MHLSIHVNDAAYNLYINDEIDWFTFVPIDQIETVSLRHDYHHALQLSTYYYVF